MVWRIEVTNQFQRAAKGLIGDREDIAQRLDAKIAAIKRGPEAFVKVHYGKDDPQVHRERFEAFTILFALILDHRDPPGSITLLDIVPLSSGKARD